MRALRFVLVPLLVVLGLGAPAHAASDPARPALHSGWTPRGEDYPATVVQHDVHIPMSDGSYLMGDVIRPADAAGRVESRRLPVVVQITAYNKRVIAGGGGGIGGASPDYLVKRGYAYVIVDARGTGTSPGTWQVFGPREQLDAKEVMDWAADQSWSDGRTAMVGPSYMGITQLFAAGLRPHGLRAIFPQVPSADVYRDVVASGGQLDVGFMPLWLGLVTFTSLIPASEPAPSTLLTVLSHLNGTGGTSMQLALKGLTGGEQAYDGPWYRQRSTMVQSVPHIEVPTFIVGGEYDLFQRGEPLIFQALHERGVPVKMIFGPWDHLQGSSGKQIPDAGYGTLAELQLRWFDHYVRGVADPALDSDIPDLTYYELGSGTWKRRGSYLSDQVAKVFRLSGSVQTGVGAGGLTEGPGRAGTATVLPVAAAGLCSRSATQWTAGAPNLLLPDNPCNTDGRLDDHTGVVFQTAPLTRPLHLLGPIDARLYTSSTTGDGLLSVRVSRVGPDGRVEPLTGGWQVVSLAALDTSRSVSLPRTDDTWTAAGGAVGGAARQIVQPWHPFTKASRHVLKPGQVAPVDVEVFPTGAVIPAGERLRVSVSAFDMPHLAPNLAELASVLSVLTIHESARYPSQLVVPTWGHRAGTSRTAPPVPASLLSQVRSALRSAAGLS